MSWNFPKYEIGKPLDWEDLYRPYSWISDMKGVPQDPIWHAEGDVLIHTKMVVNALLHLPEFQKLSEEDKHILVTAALFHDVEKRSTTIEDEIEGRIRIVAPRHAKKGAFTARTILYKTMGTPFEIREQICNLVRFHGLPLWAINKEDP
ncbi:MAG: HD domain-containing protein, partial [Bacteroidota bacterium]